MEGEGGRQNDLPVSQLKKHTDLIILLEWDNSDNRIIT
jgi:hypothetical protein